MARKRELKRVYSSKCPVFLPPIVGQHHLRNKAIRTTVWIWPCCVCRPDTRLALLNGFGSGRGLRLGLGLDQLRVFFYVVSGPQGSITVFGGTVHDVRELVVVVEQTAKNPHGASVGQPDENRRCARGSFFQGTLRRKNKRNSQQMYRVGYWQLTFLVSTMKT